MEYLMTLKIIGTKEVQEKLHKIYSSFNKEMLDATNLWVKLIERHIKMNKLTGQVLKIKTGLLRASISSGVIMIPGAQWFAYIVADRDYAAIHEFGGTIPERRPVSPGVKALKLPLGPGGKFIFRKSAAAFDMPERSYIRSTINEDEPILLNFIIARFNTLIQNNQ